MDSLPRHVEDTYPGRPSIDHSPVDGALFSPLILGDFKPGAVAPRLAGACAGGLVAPPSSSVGQVYRRVDVEGAVPPPSSNTGVEPTRTGAQACLDWLSMTWPVDTPVQDVLDYYAPKHREDDPDWKGVPVEGRIDWMPLERGAMGYKQGWGRGHVKVYFDGVHLAGNGQLEPMGVHVVMSGQGVRQFAGEQRFEGQQDRQDWMKRTLERGVEFTRIDVALDDLDGLLSMDVILQAMKEGALVSRFKGAEHRQSFAFAKKRGAAARKADLDGDVLYFGSIMSEVGVVFYDKAKEQLVKGKTDVPEHWTRCELRTKKDRAQALARLYAEGGLTVVPGVLRYYLEFKQGSASDGNSSRWPVAAWWETFLDNCEKARLYVEQAVRTVEKAMAWVEKQVAPTLAMIVEARGGAGWLRGVLQEGKTRLKPVHQVLLAGVRAASEVGSDVSSFVRSVADASDGGGFACALCGASGRAVSPSGVPGVCYHCERSFTSEISCALAL